MYAYVCVCVHACVRACVRVCVVYVCIYIYIYIYVCVFVCVCVCACVRACVRACMCVCVYVLTYICTYMSVVAAAGVFWAGCSNQDRCQATQGMFALCSNTVSIHGHSTLFDLEAISRKTCFAFSAPMRLLLKARLLIKP